MMYLMWQDHDRQRPAAQKIAAACAAYRVRFGKDATVALVNQADAGALVDGVAVRAEGRVGPGLYHVGREP